VAEALASAHRVGLVHGHLRPEHIFVLPVEQSSSRVDDAGVTTRTTGFCLKGDLSGLPELTELTPYTAPEDANGQPEARSDQFALAAIVYHMLTGRPPFADDAERGEPPSLRDTVPALNVIVDEVVRKALAAEPEQRWPDVVTFAQSFQRAAEDLSPSEQTRLTPRSRVSTDVGLGTRAPATIETSSDTQKTVFPAPTSTRKGLWVGVAALLCLGTAAVGLALRFSASAPSRPTSQLPHAPEPPAGRIEIVQLPSLEPPAPSDVPIAPAHAAEHVKRARGAAVSETAAPSAAASNGALAAPVEAAAPRKPAVPQPLPPDLAAEEALLAAPRP
jgi:serine/threonine-protein kinase